MRRKPLIAASLAGAAALVAGVLVFRPGLAPTPPAHAALAARPDSSQLPITDVILYSSGVGYFERQGEVEGNTRVDQYNDIFTSGWKPTLAAWRVPEDAGLGVDFKPEFLREFTVRPPA